MGEATMRCPQSNSFKPTKQHRYKQ
jgi:hypothetical protein